MNLYTGCIENRNDPLRLGRCQVRVVGIHTHDKNILPTSELPWAYPMQPITSAAMSGIGQAPVGVVEGTWVMIMFRDDDQQQPIILGTIGGIPQEETKNIDEDQDDYISIESAASRKETGPSGSVIETGGGLILSDSSGNPVTSGEGSAESPAETTTPTPEVNKPSGKPPPASAKRGIDAINKAMDMAGVTGKYARAAIQGITGGESGWIPQSEGHSYSASALQSVFSKTFGGKPDLAERYARWKGTKESFFDLVYDPKNNGGALGNTQPGDGGRYYGRGFIQITGRSNYSRYARQSGVDILTQPDLLNLDYEVSAQVAVAYFQDRVRVGGNDPGYFQAALSAVGGARSGWPKKEAYYNYFLGELPPTEQTDKSTKPGQEVQGVPTTDGVPSDRQQNLNTGFCDPNMKYPLRQYIGEPDTNRLARGKIEGTIVEFKDEKRLEEVATAGGGTWSQPDIPFNARYPYNKVTETESGHVIELDDTPDNERVHIYHRKGTYTEIDANGTQVNRIVGDGYYIMERNGYIYIGGACNITIENNANILVQADANIDVTGDTKINMAGQADFNVAGDMSLNVGGELLLKAGNIKIDSDADFNVTSAGVNALTSEGNFEVNAAGEARIEGSTIHWAEGAASAESSGLGDPIEPGEKNTRAAPKQLFAPPRNLEAELGYETPEENEEASATKYHENRTDPAAPEKPVIATESTVPEKNDIRPSATDCSLIYGMTSFPDSYVLHTDGTGYKWTVGAITKGKPITPGKYGLGLGRGNKDFTMQEIVCNMKALAVNILGPINEIIGKYEQKWFITSGYRNYVPAGGSATSQHLIGSAVDLSFGGNFAYKLNYDAATKIAAICSFDQMLLEYRDPGVNGNKNPKRINWLHVSYNNYGPCKKQVLTFLNDKTHSQGLTNLGD